MLTFSLSSVISRHVFHTLDPAVLRVRRKGRLEVVLRGCLVTATRGGLAVHIVHVLYAGPQSSSVVESLLVVHTCLPFQPRSPFATARSFLATHSSAARRRRRCALLGTRRHLGVRSVKIFLCQAPWSYLTQGLGRYRRGNA